MMEFKTEGGPHARNTWQLQQQGGRGDSYYYPARGIAEGIAALNAAGRDMYARKWSNHGCDLIGDGFTTEDAWVVKSDGD